ncbi:MAG: crossover junction endodeoxyribonuclease RuvC [Candidatus Levybacteria bacterium]|nr:crossover junction endodeoxyribonuclease RuvC [Candidatus Levybacteria bacterium]
MRILGIDPGIGRTGWGAIEVQKLALRRRSGQELKAQSYGCVETLLKDSLEQRLVQLYEEINKIINEYKPDELAIEELFFNTNAKTAFIVGQARGVVLLAAAQKNLPVTVYTPLQVKIAVTGYGRAEKRQVEKMVMTLLSLSKKPKYDDTSDALAVALTHAYSRKYPKITS